jgi:hypothetical protein
MWLAETKGEIRPNTALKFEAARLWLWCEKIGGTKYGPWRYLFMQQRKLKLLLQPGSALFGPLPRNVFFTPSTASADIFGLKRLSSLA